MRFDELGLAPELLKAVAEQGYENPTPIQAEAIPLVIQGKDLKACAQTGTGKTAAFTLPLLQRLLHHSSPSASPARHPVRALILAPTRELAIQVHENLTGYAKHTHFRTLCVYGGTDIKPQIAALRTGIEFLVATPGRFLDLVEQKAVSLHAVEALVLDEADRMLDMGFIPDVQRIINLLPKTRQGLLFSATFSTEIQKLADTMLRNPVMVEVAKRNAVSDTITHRVYPVGEYRKLALLTRLLKNGEVTQAIVFTRTKLMCSRLARELVRAGLKAESIHGDKSQSERIKALDAFKAGEIQALVATDVAARGIDIEDLPFVVNYELPHVPEDYVHRIGRTGRAGKQGNAISLVSTDEAGYLVEIEKLIKRPVEQIIVPGFEPDADWEYPPTGKKRRSESRTDPRPPRESEGRRDSHGRSDSRERSHHGERSERPDRGERRERRPAPATRLGTVAADGFDFNKPYEAKAAIPHVPNEGHVTDDHGQPQGQKPDLRKPRRPVAALLGGLGRKA
ncbi:DEAD/DEAH box helicase [Oryzomicrobium sp.]|uniref:DEAD/DEAH box helicase n=1 Tax=Oryzomicrobium sp. TaxID=1911578 RepID=UPI0025F3A1E4|nr:DEAD/DEAH box helicase [Oryzomicrobium sp.]MCE1244463.1 DEAD/DEAH box helicase [Oryzomicrobium sp.]